MGKGTGSRAMAENGGRAAVWPGLALFRGTEGFQSMLTLISAPLDSLSERVVLEIS